ncbi:MAG: hypothetical protein Ct9H300mP28_37450 [Pseudomonadota bacterium]|nr:MAG: hypothetical protein Ct9H300mP28_37450 [Pseudomonadota bacterium]
MLLLLNIITLGIKQMQDNQTFTKINPLNTESERINALADLLGGQQITENTIWEMASEMLQVLKKKTDFRKKTGLPYFFSANSPNTIW